MKQFDGLYTIIDAHETAYTIKLDAGHFIFKAHFPGEPITPGVIILQISLELLEELTGKNLLVSTVKNVKFLKIIRPDETPVLTYSYDKVSEENGEVRAQITVSAAEDIFARLSLVCRIL